MNIYFGDIHNHCNISYGFGNLENALLEAREHLDFCAVTGHAHWPDIFRRNEDTGFIIDFHKEGFDKLSKNWDTVKHLISRANEEGRFATFQSYEMHSSCFGDHHFISPDDGLELIGADSPGEVVEKHQSRIAAIPHHIAYTPGYRGISWKDFDERISPVVEVYSKHGCGVSDESAGEYLHTMGPRDGRNTVYSGLLQGKRFGFAGSTDHHAGYPGSYGDGLTAVLAEKLDRESIWDAILNRRTYAVTGDRIRCSFSVNGHPMGSIIENTETAEIQMDVEARNFIDRAVIYKNLEPMASLHREDFNRDVKKSERFLLRIEVGWGRKQTAYGWDNRIEVENGRIISTDKCFRGQSVLAPKEGVSHSDDVNRLYNHAEITGNSINWHCTTFRNTSTRHSSTCGLIIELDGNPDTLIKLDINGFKKEILLRELETNGISAHMKDYNSEAFLVHKIVPLSHYKFSLYAKTQVKPGDFIHGEIHQVNGQSAWISPVFIGKDK